MLVIRQNGVDTGVYRLRLPGTCVSRSTGWGGGNLTGAIPFRHRRCPDPMVVPFLARAHAQKLPCLLRNRCSLSRMCSCGELGRQRKVDVHLVVLMAAPGAEVHHPAVQTSSWTDEHGRVAETLHRAHASKSRGTARRKKILLWH